jgi:N-acetylmuramoyl-L-alanine amidase
MIRQVFHRIRASGGAALPALLALSLLAGPLAAQELTALARFNGAASTLTDRGDGTVMRLRISQPVPYRVFTLDDPRRLVIDFSEVDWGSATARALDQSDNISGLRMGLLRPGWTRMVLDLAQPMRVETAGMRRLANDTAEVEIRLSPATAESFAASAGAPEGARYDLDVDTGLAQDQEPQPRQRQMGDRPVVVVLDPGHGGIDPGAERAGAKEADLMLRFALELKEILVRRGGFTVVLTRQEDAFVPLEARMSIARDAGADLFLSLHADALSEGLAEGARVYTLSDQASDAASAKLAERHDRADLVAGVDLSAQDDVIAGILMDMARIETAPRAVRLAKMLVERLSATVVVHKRPQMEAGFSVLKAPDIPSVLLELGFMSSPADMARLQDVEWRARAGAAVFEALALWAAADAAEAQLLRQ